MALQAGFSFACSFVYLGVTFRFRDYNSRAFVVWYIVSTVELVFTTSSAAWFDVLTFTRTHLMKRLTLLTVIIIGDGVIVLARDVVTIAETPDAWSEHPDIHHHRSRALGLTLLRSFKHWRRDRVMCCHLLRFPRLL